MALAATDAVGTWDWDIGEDHFIADAHFAYLHGVAPGDAGFLPISAYLQGVHPEDRGTVARSIKHCISHGTEYAEEYRLLLPDGEVRWIFARGRCYKDHQGRPARFLGAALDLTERKTTEQALRHLNENLEERVAQRTQALAEANQRLQNEMYERERAEDALRHAQKMEAVGQLTGGIAHDFNNMLTGIIGSLDLMQRYITAGRSEEIGRFIEAAVSSAHRAAALTHRLLAFSRRQSLDRRPLDPNQLVASLEDLFRRTKGAHIRLNVQLGQDIWPVNTDASQLENALLNLVINARDAMPDGGEILIETANSYLDGTDITTLEPVKAGDYVMLGVRQRHRHGAEDSCQSVRPLLHHQAYRPGHWPGAVDDLRVCPAVRRPCDHPKRAGPGHLRASVPAAPARHLPGEQPAGQPRRSAGGPGGRSSRSGRG